MLEVKPECPYCNMPEFDCYYDQTCAGCVGRMGQGKPKRQISESEGNAALFIVFMGPLLICAALKWIFG